MYQGLIIFLNRRCTVGCATCSAAARPGSGEQLSPRWLADFFRKVETEPLDFSGYIIWTGGEPFLSYQSLHTGLALASAAGYRSEILTGGSWFSAHPEYLESLAAMTKPAVGLRISLDAEHQEKVPVQQVTVLIRRALALSMEVNFTLREIPGRIESPQQTMEEIKRQLPRFYRDNRKRSRWVHHIPHIPTAAAQSRQKGKQRCKMAFRDLVIGEDGLAYPCCGFFGLPASLKPAVGNPLVESFETIAAGQSTHSYYSPCQECR